MLPVVWMSAAEIALDAITDFVMDWNPVAALELEMQVTAAAQSLGQFPYMGRSGRVAGTRELLAHPNYWLIYRVRLDCIEIATILHTRQEYP
jgi:toxin ParE1/3/4